MQEEIYDRRDKSDREYHSRKSRHIKRTIIPKGMSEAKLSRGKCGKFLCFSLHSTCSIHPLRSVINVGND